MSALASRLEDLARSFVRELVGAVLATPLDELHAFAPVADKGEPRTHARTRKKRARAPAPAPRKPARASRSQARERSAPRPQRGSPSILFGCRPPVRGADEEE